MPWNNQNGGGGGWKSGGGGGGGPWGQGPWGNQGGGQGGGQQPDLEEILKRGQDRMKQVMRGGGGGGLPGWMTMMLALGALLAVSFFVFTFRVEQFEKGVVLRFGKVHRTVEPGLHLRLPSPIEEVRTPEVQRQKKVEVGFRTLGSRGTVASRDVQEESLMLTGDENIVDVDFVVFWIIDNAENYLFKLQKTDETVRAVAESAMREIIGKSKVSDVLAPGREPIEIAVKELMQKVLNSYEAGVKIQEVKIQQGLPPTAVRAAFEDVIAALQDKSRAQNEAQAYANKIVPEARGEAERILQAAQAYKEQTVAEANGQAGRFAKVYDEYKKAPEVTRKRMFLETMERVLNGTDKIILDQSGGGGVVPYLPLNELGRNKQQQPQPAGGR